ncbi:hypothetical protein DFH29DRAFT_983059 [Suillus ampliporus]|nr:hypothetical protein DFH29DRAFT_983059 [Suillus ampliporus]
MDLDLPPAWNLGPNLDEDDMVYHDEEADAENNFPIPNGETLGGAARVHAQGLTFLERFNDDVYADHRNDNLYYPFASFQDWELASFLLSSTLSMAAIDHFLGIELVYQSLTALLSHSKELWGRAELLPSGPKWQCHVISTDHPMKLPVHLYWRDPLDCIELLFNNSKFAKDIDLIPECIYTMVEHTVRIYGEWMTGEAAWTMQSKLPEDSTLLGVILSSDKTNITNTTGRHVAHPLLISLANIKMACLDIILKPLKQAAHIGHMMSDPARNLRYSNTTLTQLKSIKSMCDPRNIEAFFTACEPYRLSSVIDPFCWFLTLEALHHWHRESYDDNVQWCIRIFGVEELDFCFSGISMLKQHYLVAVIVNAAPPGVIIAVRALMDFRYLSQAKILNALKTFHDHKHEVISKDILNNCVVPSIYQVAHITLIKDPAESTNNQNYNPQICQYLDRIEKCQHFHTATSIAQQSQSQMHTATAGYRDNKDDGINDNKDADEAGNLQAAISDFWGTESINDVAKKFCLPDLQAALADYIQQEGQTAQNLHKLTGQRRASPTTNLPFKHPDIWFKVRVQRMPRHSGLALLPALTVNASPPDANWKHGCYYAAIYTVDGTEQWPASRLKGHVVVEVRLIMLPVSPPGRTLPWAAHFLTYVQHLDIVPQQHGMVLECTMQMHVLKCATHAGAMPFRDILPLDQLRSFTHIIPHFGPVADTCLMPQNSSKFAQSFFLNKYIDKYFYHTISESNAAA